MADLITQTAAFDSGYPFDRLCLISVSIKLGAWHHSLSVRHYDFACRCSEYEGEPYMVIVTQGWSTYGGVVRGSAYGLASLQTQARNE